MAKITVLLGELSGSIAGITFARNKAGQYARQKVTPTDAKSEAQMRVRAAFSQVSGAFHAMTPTQKAAWNSFATSIFYPIGGRVVGTTYSGQQAFVSLNQRLLNAQQMAVGTPVISIGGETSDDFATWPLGILETAPTENFAGTLTGDGGASVAMEMVSGVYSASSGVLQVGISMMGTGGGGDPVAEQPTRPSFVDSSNGNPIGFLLYGSDPVEQLGLAPRNIYKNLLGALPAPTVWDGTYAATNTFTIQGDVNTPNGLHPRKSWYAAGQTIRLSVFALDVTTGQTKLVGSKDITVS